MKNQRHPIDNRDQGDQPSPMKKRTWHKYLIFISMGFLVYALVKADYLNIPTIHSTFALSCSMVLLFSGFITNAIAQQRLLMSSGYLISFYRSIAMVGLNMFGKYIPGKMWMMVGKAAYVAERSAYPLLDLSLLFVRAQLIAIWCGLFIGMLGLLANRALDYVSWLGMSAFIGLTLVLFSQSANNAVQRMINRITKRPMTIAKLQWLATVKVLPWFLGSWLFWAVGFYGLVAGLTEHAVPWSTIACFPLAGTLGILVVLAPGGVGIRESIIVGYLSLLHFDLAEAVTIAAASRLWFLFGEIFIFLLGWVCDKFTLPIEPSASNKHA